MVQNDKKLDIGRATAKAAKKKCKCRIAVNCPLNVNCLMDGLVYRAKLEPIKGQEKVYIGPTVRTFKTRYYNCKSSFKRARYKTAQYLLVMYEK